MSSSSNSLPSNNYYDILGVSKDADTDTIRAAFRKRALELHPDKHPDEVEKYTALFKLLNQAQATLVNPSERAIYDGPQNVDNSTGLMIFSALDARKTSLKDVADALSMFTRFFNLGEKHSKCKLTVASNKSAIAKLFELSDKEMNANMFERSGHGVVGPPLCIVEFSIGAKEITKLLSAIEEEDEQLGQAQQSTSACEDNLHLLRTRLMDAISSLLISGQLIRTKEEESLYEDHKIYDPSSNKKFLLYTHEDLVNERLIPGSKIPKVEAPEKKPSLLSKLSKFLSKKNPTAEEQESKILAIKRR